MTGASTLAGVRWGSITRHADERGSFRELWRAGAFGEVDPSDAGSPAGQPLRFTQSNLSISATGVLRGLHLHRRQLDHWVVAAGTAFIALVDVRPMFRGASRPLVETRVASPDTTVSIPIGVAHGFLALEPIDLIYFVTNDYDGTDELGFAWNDPLAAVPWPEVATPDGRPVLSPRDQTNPSLSDLVARIGPWEPLP
ncbi:MAG TPA: dTDP-4-dehydrorhamnose 3,5-epimerase family protein [Candidatus Limnocylindrales bacterium]|nr:dTDP-4-dehydrorhamnose 3,5-epimerase family protein [Candidatus Limnocylindrales bacterium]